MSAFNNWDKTILKKYPVRWIWGIHIYLLLFVVLTLLFYLFGWMRSISVITDISDLRANSSRVAQLMVLPIIIAGVLFFIRQVKFNSLRVHHSVPYKNPLLHLLVFFLTFFFMSAVIPAFDLGMYHKAKFVLDEEQYAKDAEKLNLGYSHLKMSTASKEDYIWRPNRRYDEEVRDSITAAEIRMYEDSTGADSFFNGPCDRRNAYTPMVVPVLRRDSSVYLNGYRYDSSADQLIMYRNKFDSYHEYYVDYEKSYEYSDGGWDTVSRAQAIKEIADFMAIAPNYGIVITEKDPETVFNKHVKLSATQYALQLGDKEVEFDVFADYRRCGEVASLFSAVNNQNLPFKPGSLEFWQYYILIALIPAAFLCIVVSTTIRDLGWAFLAGSLTTILFSLLVTSMSIHDEWGILFLILLFGAGGVVMMFADFGSPKLKKAFGMVLHFFIPLLVFSFFMLCDALHECPYFDSDVYYCLCDDYEYFDSKPYQNAAYFVSIAFGIASIWLFNRFYTRKYVHPKE